MLPDPGVLAAAAWGAGLGGSIVLFVASLRGFRVDPGRPPGRWEAVLRQLRAPAARARLGVGVAAAIAILALTRWPVAACGVGALVVAWPYLFGGSGAELAAIARLEALTVWTESLRDTVAANASLEQAIAASTQRAPVLIGAALARLAGQMRVQTPLDAALLDLAADLDDPSADLVIAALVLNVRRRGDRLAQVLSGLAATAREELDLRRRVNAGRAGLHRAVQIIVLVTLAIAGYLTVFGGTYLHPYDSPAGQVALAAVAALFAAGFVWMRRLALVQDGAPFLARPGRAPDPAHAHLVTALLRTPDTLDVVPAPTHPPSRRPGTGWLP